MSHEIETTSGRFLKLTNKALWEVDYLATCYTTSEWEMLISYVWAARYAARCYLESVCQHWDENLSPQESIMRGTTTKRKQQAICSNVSNPIGGGELSKLQRNILREFRCPFFLMCLCCLFKLYKKGSFHLGRVTNLLSSHWDPAICLPCDLKWATVCDQCMYTVWRI